MAKADLEELFELLRPGDTVSIRGERDEQIAQIFGGTSTTTTVASSRHEIARWSPTNYDKTENLCQNIREVLLDWLAAGIDPDQCTIYAQSSVPELAELNLLLSMMVPVNWLQRNPTVKEQAAELHIGELNTGLLCYPMLMTADILAVKGDLVPVGKDQLPHLEIARDIARRFNNLYGEFFAEPAGLLAEAASLPGTDGRKMSKSYENDIKLADTPEDVRKKVMTMVTDPGRQRRSDPGYPEVCTVYAYYSALAPHMLGQVAKECRGAEIGCVQDKKRLAEVLLETLAPIQERRAYFEQHPAILEEILDQGNQKARITTQETLSEVRDLMHLPNFSKRFVFASH
jgi:tryptophanyl-tRNA synthetase